MEKKELNKNLPESIERDAIRLFVTNADSKTFQAGTFAKDAFESAHKEGRIYLSNGCKNYAVKFVWNLGKENETVG